MAPEAIAMIARNREFEGAIFDNLRREEKQMTEKKLQSPLPNHSKTKYPPSPVRGSREKMLAECYKVS